MWNTQQYLRILKTQKNTFLRNTNTKYINKTTPFMINKQCGNYIKQRKKNIKHNIRRPNIHNHTYII